MPKPRKSTQDAWLDQFDDFDVETQEALLDTCALLHRYAKRRAGKKATGAAAATSVVTEEAAAQAALTLASGTKFVATEDNQS